MKSAGPGRGTGPWWDWEITVVVWWAVVASAVLTLVFLLIGLLVE